MKYKYLSIVAACLLSLTACRATAADSPYLYGIHWWGYTQGQPIDTTPATLLDAPAHGGWVTETIITHSASWWQASHFVPLYQVLDNTYNMSMITRVDYNWGETVPSPSNPDYGAWPSNVVSVVNTLGNHCHIWQIGNEPNLDGEGNNWPNNQVTPAAYATIYRNVRNAIHSSANPSPHGEHIVLIAAPSPGVVDPGVRWMGSSDWLGQVIDNIPNDEIDGFALHSYGGTVSSFMSDLQTQLGVIDSKGLTDRGVYVTEWNRFTPTDQPWLEDNTAQFLRDAYEAVHNWNQTDGNHNIVCMTWFVYDADDQAGNGWDGYSIEYWKDNGWYPQGSSNNLFTAFEQTVDLRYPAGLVGTRGVTADFTADRTRVKPLSPVQFTDESDGTIADWQWNFGDTNTSDQQNPSHSYTQLGTYTVTLTITGNGTDSETKTNYITVRPQPGDFDEDGDVDSTDFGSMQACLTGSGIQQSDPQCSQALIDGDTDADANDVALFVGCFTGPNQSASDNCAGQW